MLILNYWRLRSWNRAWRATLWSRKPGYIATNFNRRCRKWFQVAWRRTARTFRAAPSDTASSTCRDLRSAASAFVTIPSRCGARPFIARRRMWVYENITTICDYLYVTRVHILKSNFGIFILPADCKRNNVCASLEVKHSRARMCVCVCKFKFFIFFNM